MEEHTQPTPRPRRRRPNGRWSNPATPLQAARFELRKSGLEIIHAIRRICPGHAGEPCRIDVSKLSDYETGNRRPGLDHIEAFARLYQKSPEALGLIHWRDEPTPEPEPSPRVSAAPRPRDLDQDHLVQDHLVLEWLRASAVTVATAVLESLARSPVKITTPPNAQETAPDDSPEDDPPAGAAVPD
jgi:hypothetical protein